MLIFFIFFLFFFYLVVQHSKTQSEPVSETVVTVTVTRLTVTRTPTKALVVTCPQKRPSSWKLLESNHRLWNKVGRKISKTLCTSDTSLRLPKPLSFTLMSNCSAESHNWILNLEHFLSPALFSTLFRFFFMLRLYVCHCVFEGVSLSKQTSPLCFYKPDYFSPSI